MTQRRWIQLAAVLMAVGVALGALGAHFLASRLNELNTTATWKTAVLYHLVHGLALLTLASISTPLKVTAWCFVAGIICFSGSLYALSMGASGLVFGPITPLGGLMFIVGWSWLAVKLRTS